MSDFPSDEWAQQVAATVNDDAEFARIAREFDATVRFDFGEDAYAFELGDGRVRSVRDATAFSSWDVVLRAPMDTWETFLSESPPPFYNDLRSVWTQHDMTIEGDVLTAIQHWRPLKYLVDAFGEVRR
jgi:hypothetical protein